MNIRSKVYNVSLSDYFYKINSLKKVLFAPNDFNISFFDCIKAKTHTFTPNEFYWYNLKENDIRNYISDFERKKSRSINPPEKIFLDNKLIFEEVISKYAKTPRVYACVCSGNIYGLHDNTVTIDNVIDFIRAKKEIVLKRIDGYEGKDIYVIKLQINGLFQVNGDKVDAEGVLKLFKKRIQLLFANICINRNLRMNYTPFRQIQ